MNVETIGSRFGRCFFVIIRLATLKMDFRLPILPDAR